jgi:hypothetical protein
MKSWKTTLTSAVSSGAAFVLFAQQLHYIDFPRWAMAIAMFTMAGGLATFGVSAKDSDVTGGERPATPEAQERVTAQLTTPSSDRGNR